MSAAPARASREGFILHMWTGTFKGDDGLPLFFPTVDAALAHVSRCPSWGRSAVTVYACMLRPDGTNGEEAPDEPPKVIRAAWRKRAVAAFGRIADGKRAFLLAAMANDPPDRPRGAFPTPLMPLTAAELRMVVGPQERAPKHDGVFATTWPDPTPERQPAMREDTTAFRLQPSAGEPHLEGMAAWLHSYRRKHGLEGA